MQEERSDSERLYNMCSARRLAHGDDGLQQESQQLAAECHTWPELTTRGTTLFAEAALSFRQNAAVVAIAAQ